MIRAVADNDTRAILELVDTSAMFEPPELEHIRKTLEGYASGNRELWLLAIDDERQSPAGVLYGAPEPMTEGTWNILMLVVSKEVHGRGWGRKLMSHAERALAERGARLIIVETSSTDGFEGARAFYPKCGFEQRAQIPNFYSDGDDKIVYTKELTA